MLCKPSGFAIISGLGMKFPPVIYLVMLKHFIRQWPGKSEKYCGKSEMYCLTSVCVNVYLMILEKYFDDGFCKLYWEFVSNLFFFCVCVCMYVNRSLR